MKAIALTSLLPIVASAAILPRQMSNHQSMNMGAPKIDGASIAAFAQMFTGTFPSAKIFKMEEMTPRIQRPNVKRIKFIYGPFKLHAADSNEKTGNMPSLDKYGTSYQYMVGDDFPRDITVLNGKSEVVDENFKRSDIADGIYNHHNIMMNLNRGAAPIVDCGSKKVTNPYAGFGLKAKRDAPNPFAGFKMPAISLVLGGATEEGDVYYTTPKGDFNSGYYIGPKDKLTIGLDVVNYNNVTRNVYVQSELEYIPGTVPGAGNANSQIIGVGMCSGLNSIDIHVPAGQTKWVLDSGNDITFTQSGSLIGMAGHLHDSGLDIVVKINGDDVCTSQALYGGEGHVGKSTSGESWETIREMTKCSEPIAVKKGDKIRLVANYDASAHPARLEQNHEEAEQMALLGVMFVPSH